MERAENEDLPTLSRWLDGIDEHPLLWFFEHRVEGFVPPGAGYDWWNDPVLIVVEQTLEILEAAGPAGLSAKRRAFRAYRGRGLVAFEQFMPMRTELVVASMLAAAGRPFRFNTKAGPDLLVGDPPRFGIEISSRRPKRLSHLATSTGPDNSPHMSPHMVALARHVATGVLREDRKVRQARIMPTVLIVDISGTDLPDVRSWSTTFDPLWQPADAFLALGAMYSSTTSRIPEIRFSVNPYADPAVLGALAWYLDGVTALTDFADRVAALRR
ncbi:hypothetical protein ABZS66_21155 [Dactylosporangium sp. NPDC005572]|uniref:hypothetical protein n=1 Tax=Dactylosporangium sp. NPDC005572 TaxID=3156889 RepID=UPI0033BC6CF7